MKYQLELVTWVDASADGGWRRLPLSSTITCLICKTTGCIVTEADTAIRMACTIGDMDGPDAKGSRIVTIQKV